MERRLQINDLHSATNATQSDKRLRTDRTHRLLQPPIAVHDSVEVKGMSHRLHPLFVAIESDVRYEHCERDGGCGDGGGCGGDAVGCDVGATTAQRLEAVELTANVTDRELMIQRLVQPQLLQKSQPIWAQCLS